MSIMSITSIMSKPHLITAALPYANGPIHIGHLLEYIQADIHSRFLKLTGHDALYICASDMHGTPIEINAAKAGLPPIEFVDKYFQEHQNTFASFHIKFDNYYKTHSPENEALATFFFTELKKKGYIYISTIKVVYCEYCQRSLPDRYVKGTCPKCQALDQYGDVCEKCSTVLKGIDLLNPYCSICKNKPITKDSQHYFFRLKSFGRQLREWINKTESYIQDEMRNWLTEWLDKGLEDWCISRDGPYFGFEIPGSVQETGEKKYFYVWLDAPIGYISSTKNLTDRHNQQWETYWKEGIVHHHIGKDIAYFHFLFWPAMLTALEIPLPRITVHGFITVNGQKMSKSRGTFFTAQDFLSLFPAEALRFYYASHLDRSLVDVDLSLADFQAVNNNVLLGNLANFCYRVLTFASKNYSEINHSGVLKATQLEADALIAEIKDNYVHENYRLAIKNILRLSDLGNSLFQNATPWKTKDDSNTRAAVGFCVNLARTISIVVSPVLPILAERVQYATHERNLCWKDISFTWKGKLREPAMFAVKIESIPEEKVFPLDLAVGEIIDVRDHANADSLYVLKVDFGSRGIKQVVAGLKKSRTKEELFHSKVVFCLSLKPAKLRGELSEAMILVADDGTELSFLNSGDAPLGETVKPEGYIVNANPITYDEFKKIGLAVEKDTVMFMGKVLFACKIPIVVYGIRSGCSIL